MLIDSHCHLDSSDFDADRDEVIERALEAGVGKMVAIGTGEGPPDLEAGIRMAERYPAFYATVGVHPHDAAKAAEETLIRVAELLAHPKVIAVGEIGLDYHYDFSPREAQKDVFVEQMRIAASHRKPIVIHTREAWDDTVALLEEHWAPHKLPGIMHCFSGGKAEAARALGLGFYLSFGGIVTFPKATELQRVAAEAPLDRMLVETDAPYLAPVPRRGKRNEPAFMPYTTQKLATLRGIAFDEIEAATTANFNRLVGIE
ncbi:MAG TPA: TatD family hydrolase [Bryobacteraceae bacterium]|nr:TatD family hydrolase [Bryobacteraceae bacterium]